MQVIEVNDTGAMDFAFMNPLNNPYYQNFYNYVQNQFQNLHAQLGDVGRSVVEKAQNIYNNLYGSNYIQRASVVSQMVTNTLSPFSIYYMSDPEMFKTASLYMQRYIMACPDIRQLYFQQRIDGYSDSYTNIEGEVSGVDHYDYRRVTDGVLMVEDDLAIVREYAEDLYTGDRDLTRIEQHNIMATWDIANWYISQDIDVTDPLRD